MMKTRFNTIMLYIKSKPIVRYNIDCTANKREKNIYLSYILSSVMCVDNAKNFVFWDLFWKKKYSKTYH